MKRIVSIFVCLCMLFVACFSLTACDDRDYKKAVALLDAGEYEEARELFAALGDYEDSEDYLAGFCYLPYRVDYNYVGRTGTFDITFNSDNLIVGMSSVSNEGVSSDNVFRYDERGDMVHSETTKNGVTVIYDYVFTSDGNFATSVYTDSNGFNMYHLFDYDENGNLTTQLCLDTEGYFYQIYYSYNENGLLASEEYIYPDGTPYSLFISYEYDENGNVVKEICSNEWGGQESIEYTYDDNQNVVKKVYNQHDGSQTIHEYSYDTNGNITSIIRTDDDGTVQSLAFHYRLVYVAGGITNATNNFFREYLYETL